MRNLCFLVYDYTKKGGAERAIAKLTKELTKDYNITILSVFNLYDDLAYEETKGIRYLKIFNSVKSIPKNIVRITREIRKVIKENEVDTFIAVDVATAFMAVLGTRFTNTKLIVCGRSSCYNEAMYRHITLRLYAWAGIRFSDRYQVMTEDGKRGCVEKYHIPNDKIVVIPNWIDENAIRDTKYNFKQNRIITVGRATEEKNYEELIKIAEKIQSQCAGWQWHIWGDFTSEYGRHLLKMIESKGLGGFLIHKGTTDSIYDVYSKYSFFVLTSKYEGMPNVILEAQGSKLPVISYNCKTGPSEFIENGVNGFLVELNNTEAMCKKIITLAHDQELAEEISGHANLNYERFSKSKILHQWKELLGR